ncbi:Uncharacterised protein [Mycobacteroides abscessus subsp. abscessus]|nr:Uncharacterised protein [Mycobacteroides abscessus subsp. abscessus]
MLFGCSIAGHLAGRMWWHRRRYFFPQVQLAPHEHSGPQVQSGLSQPGVISAVMHTILRPRRGRRKAIGGLRCTTKPWIHPSESRHEPA